MDRHAVRLQVANLKRHLLGRPRVGPGTPGNSRFLNAHYAATLGSEKITGGFAIFFFRTKPKNGGGFFYLTELVQ